MADQQTFQTQGSVETPDMLNDPVNSGSLAGAMLGAWGVGSPQVQPPAPKIELTHYTPIGHDTNQTVIQPLQDASQGYAKGVDGWRKAVIEAARSALGTPYAWGGNSLSGGVDCSGLVQQAFARAGIDLPRVSYEQADFGKRVSLSKLRPGDLVAWDNSSRNNGADHIAIYIGGGKIIEAARPGTVVHVSSLYDTGEAWGVSMNFD
jgi:cell wall-associated NlpC family hydrolase